MHNGVMVNEIAFRDLVRKMLDAQKTYFKTRTQRDLIEAKELERQVRKELNAVPDSTAADTDAQLSLFGE